MNARHPGIHYWSTRDVPERQQMDYYASVLSSAVDPMGVTKRVRGSFEADVESTELGPISLIRGSGPAHDCVRDRRDVARSTGRNFHLIVNAGSAWRVDHRERLGLRPGDGVLLDSRYGYSLDFPDVFDNRHLKLSEEWLTRWVPDADLLVGRSIPFDRSWGKALTAFVSQLTPEFVVAAPLPRTLIAEHVGALLALCANEASGRLPAKPATRALRDRIEEIITQRCTERSLGARDVADALGISTRTMHRALASCQQTFVACLMAARVQLATRMLESPLFRRVTTGEIGRRAGFSDASHFTRVYRRCCGRTPSQVHGRRGARMP
jgi:AraC family transcriptional regulator, positive regulator of tynA and feaB